MITGNLRHLRVFLAVADVGSLTLAAQRCNISQPAVTQALSKLERAAGGALFQRTRQGFFATGRGQILAARTRRAFRLLDPALGEISDRLRLTATAAQLRALIAVRETENFTLAARRLGLAQPTVHRAVSQLEQEAGRRLFQRSSYGMAATRPCQALAQGARPAFSELDQAEAELAEHDGREGGRIVIGSLPLSPSVMLPQALVAFRQVRPTLPVTVVDGLYDDHLAALRRGDIDFVLGALRDPAPIGDVVQEALFNDQLAILAGNGHPLIGRRRLTPEVLAGFSWVVPRRGTPARAQFDALFAAAGQAGPASIIESGSVLLMREILSASDHLGCISGQQAEAEISKGLLTRLDVAAVWPGGAIGITTRANWAPTRAQAQLLDLIRGRAAAGRSGRGRPMPGRVALKEKDRRQG